MAEYHLHPDDPDHVQCSAGALCAQEGMDIAWKPMTLGTVEGVFIEGTYVPLRPLDKEQKA